MSARRNPSPNARPKRGSAARSAHERRYQNVEFLTEQLVAGSRTERPIPLRADAGRESDGDSNRLADDASLLSIRTELCHNTTDRPTD